jgi:hypothetical protein
MRGGDKRIFRLSPPRLFSWNHSRFAPHQIRRNLFSRELTIPTETALGYSENIPINERLS